MDDNDGNVIDTTNQTVDNQTTETQTTEPTTDTEVVNEASIPTSYQVKTIGPEIAQYYGRRVLYDDFTDDDLNKGTEKERVAVIRKILNDVWSLHQQNVNEINYLENYYRGYQPILGKHKDVRPTINNIILENNAYWCVNFKVGYVFGSPYRFIQKGDVSNPQIDILNNYIQAEDKYAKDSELAESIYTSGIAHRMILPTPENPSSPFLIQNLDSKNTFIVYSSLTGNEKLMGYYGYLKIK